MGLPLVDLKAEYEFLKEEIDEAIKEVIKSTSFVNGVFVEKFEEEFASYLGVKYCICVSTGTNALYIALKSLEIGKGYDVITTPMTFFATAEAISQTGATPVFADVEKDSYTLCPQKTKELIEKKYRCENKALINKKTGNILKVLMPVHLYGQCGDMDEFLEIAKEYNLYLIEDAAQAHGAKYKRKTGEEKFAGTLGDVGCFSFYPSKNLGTYGNGGAVVTNSEVVAKRAKLLRDHCQIEKNRHIGLGWNFKINDIQAAILSVKLKYLDQWNKRRREIKKEYDNFLQGIEEIVIPKEKKKNRHVYHIYALLVKKREELLKFLHENGIGASIHYPVPVHLQKAYKKAGYKKGDFPNAERIAYEEISLPIHPFLSTQNVEHISKKIKEFYYGF